MKALFNKILTLPKITIVFVMCTLYSVKIIYSNETNPNRLWNKGDAIFYHFMAESLLNDNDLNLSNNNDIIAFDNGDFALSKFGYLTAKQSPLMTIMSLPFRYIFGPVGSLFFNILCSLGIVIILYELLIYWVSSFSALISSLVTGVCSVLFIYSFNFSPDVLSCFLALCLLISVLKSKNILIGVLAGLTVGVKLANIIIVIPILCYVFFRYPLKNMLNRTKEYLVIATSFSFSILPLLLYNNYMFSSPFKTGYHFIYTLNSLGETVIKSHENDFNLPLIKGLMSLLFNSNYGVVSDNILVSGLAFLGLFFIPKKNEKLLYLVLLIVAIQLLFYAKYDYQFASRLGNRFLLFSIALLGLPISFLVEKFFKVVKNKKF